MRFSNCNGILLFLAVIAFLTGGPVSFLPFTEALNSARRSADGGSPSSDLPEPVRITAEMDYESFPAWSADGTFLIYSSYKAGAQNLWTVEIDYHAEYLSPAAHPRKLTEGDFFDRDPCLSVEGNRVLFSSNRNGRYELFILDKDTGDLAELNVRGTQPRWSPAGDRISYVHRNNIRILELNDQPEWRNLTTTGFNEFPSWSPDASWLSFSSGYNIVSTDTEGERRVHLTDSGWNSHSDWCSSRNRIVYVSNRGGKYNLWKMNADGSNKVQLTDTPNVESFPRWSHDGRWIAFQADYEGSYDIWAIRVD